MKLRSFGLMLGVAVAGVSTGARGAALPVTVEASSLIDVQSYNLGQDATDQAYLLVTGVADGKAIDQRIPKENTWTIAPKKLPLDSSPAEFWKGDLDDGQFVLLTVTLFQGKGEDAALSKKYVDELNAVDEKVPGWGDKTITADGVKKLAAAVLAADRTVVTKIKDLYSRDKNTDHFGGQFTLIVWNNNGKLLKRLDPVGLTFGEHYGNDEKIYSKLKNTRNNVLLKNEQGEWEEEQLEPVNDDSTGVRVKELETEMVKQPGGNPLRHVTDYLVEIKVLGPGGKPLMWNAEDEVTGIDNIHTYWNFAD